MPGYFGAVEPYPRRHFMADLLRVTDGRRDPELLIGRSRDTACRMVRPGGEMAAGLFHGNYPGRAGLLSGAVLGRPAGVHAAEGGGS